jgi:hypothetical protein
LRNAVFEKIAVLETAGKIRPWPHVDSEKKKLIESNIIAAILLAKTVGSSNSPHNIKYGPKIVKPNNPEDKEAKNTYDNAINQHADKILTDYKKVLEHKFSSSQFEQLYKR